MTVTQSRPSEEEGGWEYVSDHQHGEAGAHEPHPEAAALYQPLGEAASGELAERGQTEHGGNAHDVSGDGCGDGGYCHGHWVKRSEKGHRHGEPIGGDGWEPAVLYTPLGGSNEDDGFEDEWRRIFIAGSRCEQYGGHWKGHKCVGVPNHGGHGHVTVRDVACTVAGAIGGALGGVAGALGAGGACIIIWP